MIGHNQGHNQGYDLGRDRSWPSNTNVDHFIRQLSTMSIPPWSLSLPFGDGGGGGWREWVEHGGSPLHATAWLFFVGFLIFPIWWIAAFIGTPKTRRLGANEAEKGVVLLDDPQVEYGTSVILLDRCHLTRRRCKIMADSLSSHGFCLAFHLYPVHHFNRRSCPMKPPIA
jgi:hypothetical protein